MKYIIDKTNDDMKLMYYSVNMIGLSVTPKNEVPGLKIKAKKVVLVDEGLRESYIKQRINKKIDKIIKFMIKVLNDDDTTALEEHLQVGNFGGFPSITIPNGFVSKLPVGINITGNCYDDANVLNIAYALESVMPYKGQIAGGESND